MKKSVDVKSVAMHISTFHIWINKFSKIQSATDENIGMILDDHKTKRHIVIEYHDTNP